MTRLSWILAATVANTVAAALIPARQRAVEGDWDGSIVVAGQTVEMSVHFASGDAGLTAEIDIQGRTGLKLQDVSHHGNTVHFELPAGPRRAVFDGRHAGDSIGGTFTQAEVTGTFLLTRSVAAVAFPGERIEQPPTAQHGHIQ